MQFVVITLVAEKPRLRVGEAGAAFATPSVVHFAIVLLLSAIASAPWRTFSAIAALWAVVGIGGMLYTIIVARLMSSQRVYRPVLSDWVWYVLLPFAAYLLSAIAAYEGRVNIRAALFIIAAATSLLLFVGIHNAWDSASYHVFSQRDKQ